MNSYKTVYTLDILTGIKIYLRYFTMVANDHSMSIKIIYIKAKVTKIYQYNDNEITYAVQE